MIQLCCVKQNKISKADSQLRKIVKLKRKKKNQDADMEKTLEIHKHGFDTMSERGNNN